MGIYHFYYLGVWFECRKPISYIRSMLPKKADLQQYSQLNSDSALYFVPCLRVNDALCHGFNGKIAKEDEERLLRLWRHIKQTDGFTPKRVACVYHSASTYTDVVPVSDIPVTNLLLK